MASELFGQSDQPSVERIIGTVSRYISRERQAHETRPGSKIGQVFDRRSSRADSHGMPVHHDLPLLREGEQRLPCRLAYGRVNISSSMRPLVLRIARQSQHDLIVLWPVSKRFHETAFGKAFDRNILLFSDTPGRRCVTAYCRDIEDQSGSSDFHG